MPASSLWEDRYRIGFFHCSVQLALLGVWLWLQWPRKKIAYFAFAFAVFIYCLIPLLNTVIDSLEHGEFRLRESLCDCGIAIGVSTALAIAVRLILPWRFVDAQMPGDANKERDARGSIFDLVAAVSACACAFALFQYRLEHISDSGREHPVVPVVMAMASTLSAVALLRLFAPFRFGLQVFVFLIAAPLLAGATWVGLTATDKLVGFGGELVANSVAPVACGGVFALVTSLCGMRFGGFEVRETGGRVSRLVANFICLSIVASIFVVINAMPYGTTGGDDPGLMGWPFSHAMSVQSWRLPSLLANIVIGVAATLAIGLGIPQLLANLSRRIRGATAHAAPVWQRSSTWLALICACFIAIVSFSILNVRRLRVESEMEERLDTDKVMISSVPYTPHLIDLLTARVAQTLGYEVPEEVITEVVVSESIDGAALHDICSLRELRYMRLGDEVEEFDIPMAEQLAANNRLEVLLIECPDLDASFVKTISTIASLEELAITSPLPDVSVEFGQQLGRIDIDLRENSQVVKFPERLWTLAIKLSDETDLSGMDDTYRISELVINCSERTLPVDLRMDLRSVILQHGDTDLSMRLRGETMFDCYFAAARDPALPKVNSREPSIHLEFWGRYGGHQFEFQDASCFLKTPDPDFEAGAVTLKETGEVSIAQQIEALSAKSKWWLTLEGRIDEAACEQLGRLIHLQHLAITSTPQTAGIPFDILEPNCLAEVTDLSISGVAISQKQFDGLLRAATNLRTIEIDGSLVSSVDLMNHSNLASFVATNSPGLTHVRFGPALPSKFVVTGDSEADAKYVIQGPGFDRETLRRIFSNEDVDWVELEDEKLDAAVWEGMDFGEIVSILQLADFPPSELYESWTFDKQLSCLMVSNQRQPPRGLLTSLFEQAGPDFFVDLSVDPYPNFSEGHVLSLIGRPVTDQMIEEITTIKSLRELYLYDTGMTDAQVKQLRRRCPWIETIYADELSSDSENL